MATRLRAKPYVAQFATPSGTRKVPIRFFATSRKDALRIARSNEGKGLLFGLTLSEVAVLADPAAEHTVERRAA
jgi:hypothetical protein